MGRPDTRTTLWTDEGGEQLYASSYEDDIFFENGHDTVEIEQTDAEIPLLADLVSSEELFGAEVERVLTPENGFWHDYLAASELTDGFFSHYDMMFGDHEVIIADGSSSVYDSSTSDTVIFASGETAEITVGEKKVDLFVSQENLSVVHANDTDLTLYTTDVNENPINVIGSLSKLTLHLVDKNGQSSMLDEQSVKAIDEKIINDVSGQVLVDLSELNMSFHNVSLFIHHQDNSIKQIDLPILVDGPEITPMLVNRDAIYDELEGGSEIDVRDLLVEDQIFSEAAEVQLKGATFDTHSTGELAVFAGSEPEIEVFNSTEMAASSTVEHLLDVDDLLSRGVVYDEPIDVLDELFNDILE